MGKFHLKKVCFERADQFQMPLHIIIEIFDCLKNIPGMKWQFLPQTVTKTLLHHAYKEM